MRGPFGYYTVSRSYTQGNVKADNIGLFLQDAWTVNGRLTVNLGLRAENEDVPSLPPGESEPALRLRRQDRAARRLRVGHQGDSRWKMYSSYGVFYDLLKLTIGRVMFGADRWVNYYYTLDTGNWPSIACDGPQGSGCPGTFIALFDNRSVSNLPDHNLVDPNLQLDPDQGVHLRHRPRVEPDHVDRHALRPQVGAVGDRGGLPVRARPAKTAASTTPATARSASLRSGPPSRPSRARSATTTVSSSA